MAAAGNPAGYSGNPLWRKLGLKEGQRVYVFEPPRELPQLLEGAPRVAMLARFSEFDVGLIFIASRAALAAALPRVLGKLAAGGMIWVAWPKKASGVATDVTEDTVRDVALPLGIVDVKVCAIDATWSGLKLLRRRPQS
jgi:hypothetical protein